MVPGRYRLRPDVFEAVPVHELIDTAMHAWDELPEWVRTAQTEGVLKIDVRTAQVTITTLVGAYAGTGTDMLVNPGHGSRNLLMLPRPAFDERYEPVVDPAEKKVQQ